MSRRSPGARRALPSSVAVLPWAWVLTFGVVPLLALGVLSFFRRGTYGGWEVAFSGANYLRLFDWIYLRVLGNSVGLAAWTTFACFALGFPLAYWMATATRRARVWLLSLVVLPFWTNFVVRAYAIKVTLALFPEAWGWMNSPGAVAFGMVSTYLPFFVLPTFVALERFDFTWVEAARDLGASPMRIFFRVILPLSIPGWLTGALFVFTPALGEFVIPDLLGGARLLLAGHLVSDQFLKARDWPFGSALACFFLAVVALGLLARRYLEPHESSRRSDGLAARRVGTPLAVRALGGITLALLLLPLAVMAAQSAIGEDGALTLSWFARAATDGELRAALGRSLAVGAGASLLATAVGGATALAWARTAAPARGALGALTEIGLAVPEIILGISLLAGFSAAGVSMGLGTVLIGHACLALPYVTLAIRARLDSLDPALDEAAEDLGSSRWHAFRRVTLPLVAPALGASFLMAFTLSFDDFLVAFFTTGPGADTLPLKIYGMIRYGVSREIHAVSTGLLLATIVAVVIASRAYRESSGRKPAGLRSTSGS